MWKTLAALPVLAALAACQAETETTPAEVTAQIRAFAEAQCGAGAGFEPGYLSVVDISKDGRPDYAVDFAALRCGGEEAVLCGEDGCPREIWVSDGRGGYVEAFGMNARAFSLNAEATPPSVEVTLVGEACPPRPDPAPAPGPAPTPAASEETQPPRETTPTCNRRYVFDPIRLRFHDADRAGPATAPTEPPPENAAPQTP